MAYRFPTHETLVLSDGSVRTFDGFGSVHRERSRCDTDLGIVAATRHDDGYDVLTDQGSIWRVTASPCRKRRLRASDALEDVAQLRVCEGQVVAQHRDGAVRLWSVTGELLDEEPPPASHAQHWIARDHRCALCLHDTCYRPSGGRLVVEPELSFDICVGPRESWPPHFPPPCLPGAASIPIGHGCRLLWQGPDHAVSCFAPRMHGADVRRPYPEGW